VIDIREVVGRVEDVRRAGSGYLGRCPAHDDRHASLSIAAGDRVPVVLNCKAGCEFEVIASKLGFSKGELTATDDRGLKPTRAAATYTYRNADGTIFARKERLIDDIGAKSFRWSRPDPANASRWISGTEGLIPLYRLPELIGARSDETVVIVEGEKDADRLSSLGFIVTTTPNGAAAKWRESDSQYFAGRRVCVIADDDEAGKKKAADTASALRGIASSVGGITLPNPNRIKGFDASDFIGSGGTVEELRKKIKAFDQPRPPAEVVPADVLEERTLKLWETGDEPGAFPGWDKLKAYYRPRRGELTIITGAPNAGKSTFLDDMMIRIACGDQSLSGELCAGWRWLIYSAEQFPPERHASKLLQKLLNKPFVDGPTARMTPKDIRAGMQLLKNHFTLLDPSFGGCNIDRILEIGHEVNVSQGFDALVIDPYNVVAANSRAKQQSEHDFIGELLTRLRTFAQTERVHVVVVAHPTKLKREADETEYPVPRPWDISGSGHWYNHADAILSVWRAMKDEQRGDAGEVEIHVQKIRFQPECGQLGMVKLYFDRITSRFHEEPRTRKCGVAPWEASAWKSTSSS
jgi:replicative DNA helicase